MVKGVPAVSAVQENSMKRHKKTGDSLQVSASDFEEAVSLLREDESIPPYMKTLFGILLEEREVHAKKEAEQLQRNRELAEENAALRAEIDALKWH
ncbi:hypothetical protein Y032_0022g646 [Ancylostoma ceylanicum]|uniref:Uncharacterized protein n=1 Tax=Ancylostoma ceylanicum TaxID=53326 RepID=A0A016V0D0_9BILA|nr:hypothetical protein Y032_0022g646 [Ancylostoma ceylanicum]